MKKRRRSKPDLRKGGKEPLPRPKPVRILLIGDRPILLQGLTQLVNQEENLAVCGQAEDGRSTLKLIPELKPDLAIMDFSLSGGNGLQLIRSIRANSPKLPVLVLSPSNKSLFAERALRFGARGYIMKREAVEQLLVAIRRVVQGEIYVCDKIASSLLRTLVDGGTAGTTFSVEKLSDRELEVLQFLGQGHGTRQIAKRLHLSIKTIYSYREHLKEKLNLGNANELVLYAVRWVHLEFDE